MELKSGYKQSEVGIIPEDWEVEPLGGLADFITSGSRGWAQFYSDSGALFIRSQNVRDGRLSFADIQYVSPPSGAEGNRTKVKPSDLLITVTGNSVGNVALVEQAFDEAYISQHVGLVRLKEPTSGAYICRYLSPGSPGNQQIASSQSGQSKPGLNLQNLKDFFIALPPTPCEQRAIATALSDVDGLLGGLDRLIAKKRDLKQAAMQQLLTGQTRLPGFHGEWEVKRLGDVISHCFSGATPRRNRPDFYKGNIRWITSGELNYNVIIDTLEKITSEAVALTNLSILPVGTFLMAITGLEAEGTRGACGIVGAPSTTNQSCMAVFPTEALTGEYLFHYYVFRGKSIALQYCQGTKQQSYTASLVKQLPIELPPTVPEQTAIAEILTEMDAEITALVQRRDKTRALKQAMMKELLTGRTRLIEAGKPRSVQSKPSTE